MFYFDEDSWALLHVDMFDAKGNLWRAQEGSVWANPQIQACTSIGYVSYDLDCPSLHRRRLLPRKARCSTLTAGLQGRVNDKMFNSDDLRRRGER